MEQTGWHITILAGGPSPEHDVSEYEISKAKNITKLRRQLAEVDKEYPFPEEPRQKKEVRKQSSSKKDKAPQGEAVQQESTRIKATK